MLPLGFALVGAPRQSTEASFEQLWQILFYPGPQFDETSTQHGAKADSLLLRFFWTY